DSELLLDSLLPDELGEGRRAKRALELLLAFLVEHGRHEPIAHRPTCGWTLMRLSSMQHAPAPPRAATRRRRRARDPHPQQTTRAPPARPEPSALHWRNRPRPVLQACPS